MRWTDSRISAICAARYSKAELRELDDYAAEKGMELIPCTRRLRI